MMAGKKNDAQMTEILARRKWRRLRPNDGGLADMCIFRLSMCIVFRFLYTWCTRGTQSKIFNIVIVLNFQIHSNWSRTC